jgi:hypothetical protein
MTFPVHLLILNPCRAAGFALGSLVMEALEEVAYGDAIAESDSEFSEPVTWHPRAR